MAPSPSSSNAFLITLFVFFCCQAAPVAAFGAGNIQSSSAVEGQNFRHGDIEDTLLTILVSAAAGGEKFSKLDVKRVYFGNWLRDYSQAVDVGTLKNVSSDAIRILLWLLGFLSFGYGTREFEVTKDRLGCYRPEEHIDNPKDYADNADARQYDSRLRGPVNNRELEIDGETGLKNYIANENMGIDTSAGLVRGLLRRSIELGRKFGREKRREDWCEALRLLGTATHCLEDFSAHSNYTELCLREIGEDGVFPHVGEGTEVELGGAGRKFPLVTGTFGGTDFLHSVCGEVTDKATQSEIQELEGTFESASSADDSQTSILQGILSKLPSGIFGDGDKAEQASKLQQNAQDNKNKAESISPREAEEWTRYLDQISKEQILPVMQFHDDIMMSVTQKLDHVPILPELIEQLQDALNVFIFSLIAPFVLPVIRQVKAELETGSSEIIQSAKQQQHQVFEDDNCSDPSHSMLSKDHFTNILNPVAGRVACAVLKWAVPQVIACFDDENRNADEVVNTIIRSVFHHPALRGDDEGRNKMFDVVREWWDEKSEGEKSDIRDQLSRDGVREGRNHKEGEHDTGHGNRKPLGMRKIAADEGRGGGRPTGVVGGVDVGKKVEEAAGGGLIGAIAGGLAGQFTKAFQQVSTKEGEGEEESGSGGYKESSSYGRQGRQGHGEGYGTKRDDDSSSRRDNDDDSSSRQHGRRDDNESSGYGSRRDRDDNESSGYGGRRDDGESSGYGSRRQEDSHRRRGDDRDDNQRSEYGGRRDDNESSSYGRDDNESSSYSRRQQEEASSYSSHRRDDDGGDYIRRDTGNRSRRDDEEGQSAQESYGRSQVEYGADEGRVRSGEQEGFGNTRVGQYAGNDNERRGGYGGGRRRDEDESEGVQERYGRMQLEGGADEGDVRAGRYGGGEGEYGGGEERGYGGRRVGQYTSEEGNEGDEGEGYGRRRRDEY